MKQFRNRKPLTPLIRVRTQKEAGKSWAVLTGEKKERRGEKTSFPKVVYQERTEKCMSLATSLITRETVEEENSEEARARK
jgi:hypothetical protein